MFYPVFSVILFLIFNGCNHSRKPENVYTIQYEFRGSSVSPEYHRSYTIKMDSNKVIISISDYDSVLAESKYQINPDSFKVLLNNNISILGFNKYIYSDDCDGCTFGTIDFLNKNGEPIKTIKWSGKPKDPIVEKFINDFKALIPNLQKLIDSTKYWLRESTSQKLIDNPKRVSTLISPSVSGSSAGSGLFLFR
jgi:hypothetical protein